MEEVLKLPTNSMSQEAESESASESSDEDSSDGKKICVFKKIQRKFN